MLLEGGKAPSPPEEYLNRIYVTVLRSSVQTSYTEQERQRLYGMLREFLGSVVVLFSPIGLRLLVGCRRFLKGSMLSLESVTAVSRLPA
jgi:hypothetical protein